MVEKQYDDAESWALSVHQDQPHSLEELQRRLQASGPGVIERAARPWSRVLLDGMYLILSALSLLGPIAAVTVFFDMSEAVTKSYDFDLQFELSVALVGFLFGMFFQGRMLCRWWREGRYRDSAVTFLSALVLLCAIGTIVQAYWGNDYSDFAKTLYLIPAMITGAGSAVSIWLSSVAPPSPKKVDHPGSRDRDDSETSQQQMVDLGLLTGDAKKAVLKDRNNALDALYIRGLLEAGDVSEIRSRPLGRLTESEGDVHGS